MAEAWINSRHRDWQAKTGLVYAVTLSQSGELVGAIGLLDMSETEAELAYWIGEPFWGEGYCTEAAQALLSFSFTELALRRIHAQCLASNPASGRVMEKIGMVHIGSEHKKHRGDAFAKMEIYEIRTP